PAIAGNASATSAVLSGSVHTDSRKSVSPGMTPCCGTRFALSTHRKSPIPEVDEIYLILDQPFKSASNCLRQDLLRNAGFQAQSERSGRIFVERIAPGHDRRKGVSAR